MALAKPPAATVLARLPPVAVGGRVLHRIVRHDRAEDPWYFASTLPPSGGSSGRFDLPRPHGACYTACSAVGAALEVFQDWNGSLPRAELAARRRIEVAAPPSAPPAADLTAPQARGAGVTVAVWGGGGGLVDRARTQEWARALHAAGWNALHHGVQHDTTGTERAVTLLDANGQHRPFGDEAWSVAPRGSAAVHTLHDDLELEANLRTYGVHIVDDTTLDVVDLDQLF